MNYREEIGAELQTLRVQKGLTVRELAEASGVHYSNIAKIENGKYNVSVDILGKVADALGCKLTFEPKEITLQWLADRLNSVEDWPLWANAVIERMGWIDETGNDYGICSDGEYRLSYDDNMVAVVNRIE